MHLFTIFTLLFCVFSVGSVAYLEFDVPPETVSDFDPNAYAGRWYQMYASLIPRLTYEKKTFCVVADYSNVTVSENRATFNFVHTGNKGGPTGELVQGIGRATNNHFQDSPGEFRLAMDKSVLPFAGFYWIVKLGDIEPGYTEYPYAIVSVPFQTSLFILARDVDEFRLKYKDVVLQLVKDMGYTYFFNRPIETYQSAECAYPPTKPLPPKPEPKPEPPKPESTSGPAFLRARFLAHVDGYEKPPPRPLPMPAPTLAPQMDPPLPTEPGPTI